jgi:hypothetical protein
MQQSVEFAGTYHLAVGEEGNIRDGLEGLVRAVELGAAAAVAHVGAEHGLGDILGVVPVGPAELVLQVVDAVLLLVPRDTRAACDDDSNGNRRETGGSAAESARASGVLH